MQSATITLTQSALIAFWIALVMSRGLGYSTLMLRFTPMMTGLVVGVVMHNVPLAMTTAAAIQLIYMGVIAPGGTMPSEPAVAAAVAIPAAIVGGLSPTEAIAIAVPVGLLGSYLYSTRFLLNTLIVTPLSDRYAKEANDRGLTFSAIIVPIIISFALFFPLMLITLYKGVPLIASLVQRLSGTAFHVLTVISGGLASIGIALTIKVIGKRSFLPFFVLAFFLTVAFKPLGMNTVMFAVIGGMIAFIYVLATQSNQTDSSEKENTNGDAGNKTEGSKGNLTNRDIHLSWLRWWYINEIPHTYDRMLAFSLLWALAPNLRKLYGNNEKELQDAYVRHTTFFNTQAVWGGGTITGITLSLEEARARSLDRGAIDEVSSLTETINTVKVGLMGPLAAIGDTIDSGTVQYILIALALPWAKSGSMWGALFPWIAFVAATYTYGYYFTKTGYYEGRTAALSILGSKRVQNLIMGMSILGLFMMGVLGASYVQVSSSLAWTIAGKKFVLQDILDKILPGLLPFATIMGVYLYFEKKGLKVLQAILWLVAILGVLAWIHIL
jgi:PTS system mannose-specific IID component